MGRFSLRAAAGMLVVALLAASCQTAPVATKASGETHVSTHEQEQVIHITAKRFEYSPKEFTVKKGVPVVLEMTSLDRTHGFFLKAFGIDEDIHKGKITRVRFIPDRVGRFEFHCDNYCGDYHEDMEGWIVVVDG